MDVSRIEAVTPRTIDWRRLTAKEIIKYENEGVEVPPQYLSWAKEFLQSLDENDKDTTTYEMAKSQSSIETEDNSTTTQDTNNKEQPQTPDNSKTSAQQKREELINEGNSLQAQAQIFTSDSSQASNEVLQSANLITETENKSNDEIQSLETHMSELLTKADATKNEIKGEISKINSDQSNKSTFAKIEKLQGQLHQIGETAQANLTGAETDFNTYDATINSQTDVIFNAEDFGTVTADVGNELLDSIRGAIIFRILDYIIGKRAVNTGEETVSNSQTTNNLKNEALSLNSDNKSKIYPYQDSIKEKTGVTAAKPNQQADNETQKDEESKLSKDESLKTTAAITETEKAASANLEQILMSKIRRGEDFN